MKNLAARIILFSIAIPVGIATLVVVFAYTVWLPVVWLIEGNWYPVAIVWGIPVVACAFCWAVAVLEREGEQ